MKLSKWIKKLQNLQEKHGDLDVYCEFRSYIGGWEEIDPIVTVTTPKTNPRFRIKC